MPNNHQYSLAQVRGLLKVAQRFIDFKEPKLFRIPGNAVQTEVLKNILIDVNWSQTENQIDEFILGHISPSIGVHEWASIFKYYIQNMRFYESYSFEINLAKKHFSKALNQLYQDLSKLQPPLNGRESKPSFKKTQVILLEYLQALSQNKLELHAQIIHEYLHIAHRVWSAQLMLDNSNAAAIAEQLAPVMGLCLFDGLELTDKFKLENKSEFENEGKAIKYINSLMEKFLQDSIFQMPFDASKIYSEQLNANFQEDLQALHHFYSDCLKSDLPIETILHSATPPISVLKVEQKLSKIPGKKELRLNLSHVGDHYDTDNPSDIEYQSASEDGGSKRRDKKKRTSFTKRFSKSPRSTRGTSDTSTPPISSSAPNSLRYQSVKSLEFPREFSSIQELELTKDNKPKGYTPGLVLLQETEAEKREVLLRTQSNIVQQSSKFPPPPPSLSRTRTKDDS